MSLLAIFEGLLELDLLALHRVGLGEHASLLLAHRLNVRLGRARPRPGRVHLRGNRLAARLRNVDVE